MARKLKNLDVKFISLVDRPANKKAIVYKSDEDDARVQFRTLGSIVKSDAKEGIVCGTVYEPLEIDSQDDFTDAQEIVKACHNFAKAKRMDNVDFQHNYQPGAGTVVESFIKSGPHPDFPHTKDGAWCVKIQVSEAMKANMDKIGGLSLAGDADTFETSVIKNDEDKAVARVGGNVTKSRVIKSRVRR